MIRKTVRPVFIDIDGTLTTRPRRPWGPVIKERIDAVRDLIEDGYQVVLWSGGGTPYARKFAEKYGLEPLACIGKPEGCVDDNPDIRPRERMKVHAPDSFFGDR